MLACFYLCCPPSLAQKNKLGRSSSTRLQVSAVALSKDDTETSPGEKRTRPVYFSLEQKFVRGETVSLVGDCEELGGWKVAKAIPMTQMKGVGFGVTVDVPVDRDVQYKFLTKKQGTLSMFTRTSRDQHISPRCMLSSLCRFFCVTAVGCRVPSRGQGLFSSN